MSVTPMIIPAVIYGVNGTTPGPSSGISYNINLSMPGNQIVSATNVVPHGTRWSDDVDINAAEPGTAVLCFDVGGRLQFFIDEKPATTECSG
jgi:hypothetical protein